MINRYFAGQAAREFDALLSLFGDDAADSELESRLSVLDLPAALQLAPEVAKTDGRKGLTLTQREVADCLV